MSFDTQTVIGHSEEGSRQTDIKLLQLLQRLAIHHASPTNILHTLGHYRLTTYTLVSLNIFILSNQYPGTAHHACTYVQPKPLWLRTTIHCSPSHSCFNYSCIIVSLADKSQRQNLLTFEYSTRADCSCSQASRQAARTKPHDTVSMFTITSHNVFTRELDIAYIGSQFRDTN